ncbi:MAG: DUF3370 domain-containing protein, partial [Microcystaceae cyanobacterium]
APNIPGTITPPPEEPREILVPQSVRPLTGSLDNVPVLNSNSPELIFNDGIIISTLPSIGMGSPYAHLNFPFKGRFDVFAHHVVQASPQSRTLYLGILLFNGRSQPVTIDVLQGSAYRTNPDALFRDLLGELPPFVEDPNGMAYAGPGSRSTNDILRGKRQAGIPAQIAIAPGQSQMLVNVPIPVNYTPDPTKPPPVSLPRNGFSAYYRLNSNGEVFGASMAMYAPLDAQGNERPPTVLEWQRLLQTAKLMEPRDRIPRNSKRRIYSRVAGVSIGSQWRANLTDANSNTLAIPAPGQAFSYPISTLEGGRLGTGQNQSAKMTERYPDTAYEAHGNYGVQYALTLPLVNNTGRTQQVAIALESPLKADQLKEKDTLRFLTPSPKNVFFRGTVQVRYADERGAMQNRYFHVILKRGQQGPELATINLPAGD